MACDFGVIAINSQQILRQVIATDAKEINLFAALVDDKHHRRDFQHDAKRDFLIKRNMLSAELLFRFGKFLSPTGSSMEEIIGIMIFRLP